MNFNRRPRDERDELLNITSMVDVVFILLAFFVLSTQFIEPERDVAVGMRPSSPGGSSASDLPEVVTVRLQPLENEAGDSVAIHVQQVTLPPDDFAAITARLGAVDLPTIPVILAADEDVRIDAVAQALDAILASPMRNVSLARPARP